MNPEPLMSLQDVAVYLDIPEQTLYRWRHHGEGPRASKVGRHLRYRRADVEAWLDEQADKPKAIA